MVQGLLGFAPPYHVIVDDCSAFDFVSTSRGTNSSEYNGSHSQAISHENLMKFATFRRLPDNVQLGLKIEYDRIP